MSSGNFDFPPASSSSNGQGSSQHLARLLHIRQAIQREAEHQEHEQQIAQDFDDITSASRSQQRPTATPTSSMPRRNRRATRGMSRSFNHSDAGNRSQLVPPQETLRISAMRNRPHAEPSQRFNALRRVRQQREQFSRNSGLADLEQAGERLTEVSHGLSHMLDSSSQMFRVELDETDDGTGQRRFKRRKLDRDDSSSFSNIKYGHFGQVVPGRLKMEIVSCDGGEFNESSGDLHKVENVLKNDASVYCTKRSNCNLLLRHHGETNFSLDKLVIKAPDYGFTSPVQEGMVFVAMDSQYLMDGTAPYQIDYDSPSPSSRSSSASSSSSRRPERISLYESLHDPEVLAGTLNPGSLNRREHLYDRIDQLRGAHEARFARLLRIRRRIENVRHRENWENCDINESNAIVSPAAPSPPPQLQGLNVTQEADNDSSSDSDEEPPSASIMADRLRRDNRWRASSEDDDYEEDARQMNLLWDHRSRTTSSHSPRTQRRNSPSKVEPDEGVGDVLAPHARFFMQGPTSKITIRFDPPVSGKYVLLKLWSPVRHGNIDIEHIAVHGYAGPRSFPACEMR
ncbi:hypothetical protein IWX90DRAFT_485917 [Phyllosticta citrichinensis]|uniref:Uncharacterized protein n=1 Tax=Phyllosticta citrichinensis TaxID=1130410 RepID=A0ABR1XX86_9PEZI